MDTIIINKKEYPITINMNVLAAISKHSNLKLNDIFKIQDLMDFEGVLYFIWAAVKEGCRLEKQTFDLTVEDVGAGADMNTVADFMRIFINSQAPPDSGENDKKKVDQTSGI